MATERFQETAEPPKRPLHTLLLIQRKIQPAIGFKVTFLQMSCFETTLPHTYKPIACPCFCHYLYLNSRLKAQSLLGSWKGFARLVLLYAPPNTPLGNHRERGKGREDEMLIADTAAEIAPLLLVWDIKKVNEQRSGWKEMLRWG